MCKNFLQIYKIVFSFHTLYIMRVQLAVAKNILFNGMFYRQWYVM